MAPWTELWVQERREDALAGGGRSQAGAPALARACGREGLGERVLCTREGRAAPGAGPLIPTPVLARSTAGREGPRSGRAARPSGLRKGPGAGRSSAVSRRGAPPRALALDATPHPRPAGPEPHCRGPGGFSSPAAREQTPLTLVPFVPESDDVESSPRRGAGPTLPAHRAGNTYSLEMSSRWRWMPFCRNWTAGSSVPAL